MFPETTLLLERRHHSSPEKLSVLFAVICVVDVFGVFPIITLPKAIINCGFYGIILVTVVCLLQIYTATLLGKCWVFAADIYPTLGRKSRYPYSALAEVTFGKALSNFVNVLLDLTVFSGGIPNLIVASRNLQLLGLRISEGEVNISECYWILIVGVALCPVLWLGSPKDMKCICTVSVFMVFSVFLLLLGCLLFDSKPTNSPSEMLGSTDIPIWRSMLIAYGILAFQFDIHPTILTIQVDMKEKSKLPKAMFLGFMATLLLLGITTTVVVLMYGTDIQPSILETLPTTIPSPFCCCINYSPIIFDFCSE
ncbi:hypothetical protein NQ317_009269 [Molorchus minor]|uniref:Amino acid transporter transmembrane domain-containing protein n=1 Tax=Molorchus minor TaxID=1323400 RepID=A0ABQ9IT88_9CUCU|nr:hypothetical protein NQ317_009269 [Molorchus minor]